MRFMILHLTALCAMRGGGAGGAQSIPTASARSRCPQAQGCSRPRDTGARLPPNILFYLI